MNRARTWRLRGFTLVELLVVISILCLLLAMLSPTLSRAKRYTRKVVCQGQFHQIGVAFTHFAGEHEGLLPGTYSWVGPAEWQKSWMGKEVWYTVNYYGTICSYVGGPAVAQRLYRCPDLAQGVWNTGVGSNGRFDYSMFLSMAGARMTSVPAMARYQDPGTKEWREAATPVVVEEDPTFYLNYVNIEPGHSNVDRMGNWHVGNSCNYLARDISGHSLYPSALGPSSHEWQVLAPSGATVTMQHVSKGFGEWNGR